VSDQTVVEDFRCGTSFQGGLSNSGDRYFLGDQYWAWFRYYGPQHQQQCVLRIREGESGFDSSFQVELDGATDGHPLSFGAVLGDRFFLAVIDEQQSNWDLNDPRSFWGNVYTMTYTGSVNDWSIGSRAEGLDVAPGQAGIPSYQVDDIDYVEQSAWPSEGSIALRPVLDDFNTLGDGLEFEGTLFENFARIR